MYALTNADGSSIYVEGTAEDVLDAMLRYGVKFSNPGNGDEVKVVLR